MTEEHAVAAGGGAPLPGVGVVALSAGAQLTRAREAAGLTQDAVAQQLKLAPRQVMAIEEGDYSKLPGRTFVRGFVRNYARLLHLDPEALIAALPGGVTPSLDSPALHPTAHTMGELPASARGKHAWARWAIPLTLIAIIAVAASYDIRQRGSGTGALNRDAPPPSAPSAATTNERPAIAQTPATEAGSATAGKSQTPIPNPLATGEQGFASGAPAGASLAVSPATAVASTSSGELTGISTMVLTFRDSSWTEVRDHTGRVLLSKLVRGGQTRELSGVPPFELVIGNASEVELNYRGVTIELAPYTTKGIARLSLE